MKLGMLVRVVLMLGVAVILVSPMGRTQIPRTMSYQGVLTNADGTGVPDGDYSLGFCIYDVSSGGIPLWKEVKVVPVVKATFNAILGTVLPLDLPFDRPYWLGIQVQGEPELSPRTLLTASPYAMNVAAGAAVKSLNGLTDSVTIAAGANVTITPAGNTLTIASTGATSDGDWVISGDNLYAGVSGNVGIGIASPSSRLHVAQNVNAGVGISIQNTSTGGASHEYLEFADENGALAYLAAYDDNSGYGNALIFANNRPGGYLRYHTGGAEKARLDNAGNFGIGTAEPLSSLHVKNYSVEAPAAALNSEDVVIESADAVLGLYSTPSGSAGSCISLGEILAGALVDKWSIVRQTTGGGGGLMVKHGTNPDPMVNETVMYLDDNGEVGIGTANPGAALDIAGQIKIAGGAPGTGKVLTSDASGLASWKGVTAEYWISPGQLVGTQTSFEVVGTNEGYVKVRRLSDPGISTVFLYIDIPGKISGVQQRLQGISITYAVENALDRIWYTLLNRLNTDGTGTDIWVDSTHRNSTVWTTYGFTDSTPELITGPLKLRIDMEFEGYGGAREIYIGSVKVWTVE
ncbi:MAG: hypothetical protein C4574_06490 [Candidatus Latescibacterota bacterium]|nr:MAG: hypothetical protein C4574_06490 [Candidatus Latescibacterota bacterium]